MWNWFYNFTTNMIKLIVKSIVVATSWNYYIIITIILNTLSKYLQMSEIETYFLFSSFKLNIWEKICGKSSNNNEWIFIKLENMLWSEYFWNLSVVHSNQLDVKELQWVVCEFSNWLKSAQYFPDFFPKKIAGADSLSNKKSSVPRFPHWFLYKKCRIYG